MSWAQQRQAIKLAAEAGVRARTSAAGSETLPLTHHHLRYAMLSRPNGELTRAGQYYCQLIGRPPPSRQYDRNQPLIREGPNDYIMLRGGAKKLLRSLQPNGNYQLTKLGKHFFKDKWVDWVVHVPVIIGRFGVSHGVLPGRLGFHMGWLGFHLGFCRAVGGFLKFAVTLEPPSPSPKSSTRKLKLQTPSPTASWRDEPAVKLKPVELDHSFMQIAVLLLEPEDSQLPP